MESRKNSTCEYAATNGFTIRKKPKIGDKQKAHTTPPERMLMVPEKEKIYQAAYEIFRLANAMLEMSRCEGISAANTRMMLEGPIEAIRQLGDQITGHASPSSGGGKT